MNRRLSNAKCFEFPTEVLREYFGDSLLIFLFYPSDHLQNLILVSIINFPFFFFIFLVFFFQLILISFLFIYFFLILFDFVFLRFFSRLFYYIQTTPRKTKTNGIKPNKESSLWIKVVVTNNVHQRIFSH